MSTPLTRRVTMSQELIDAWAALSSDFNPLHVSPEWAAQTSFGGTIAHGHYTLALMEQLMLTIDRERWLRGGRLQRVRFRAPVRPTESYVLTATEQEARSDEARPGLDRVWRLELRAEAEDVLAAEAEAAFAAPAVWTS